MATNSKKAKKGTAGKNTGGKTRKVISKAKKKGASTKQIAKAGNRSPSTINNIESGNIKNPPSNLSRLITNNLKGAKFE